MHTGESSGPWFEEKPDIGSGRPAKTNIIDVQDMNERYWMLDTQASRMSNGPIMDLFPHLPQATSAIIVSTNKGRGRRPSKLILPGQLYLRDVVEYLETGAYNVEVYPVLQDQPWIEVARRVR